MRFVLRLFFSLVALSCAQAIAATDDGVILRVTPADRDVTVNDSVSVTVTVYAADGTVAADFVGTVELYFGTNTTPEAALSFTAADNGAKATSLTFGDDGQTVIHAYGTAANLVQMYGTSSVFVNDNVTQDFDGLIASFDPYVADTIEFGTPLTIDQNEPFVLELRGKETSSGEIDEDFEGDFIVTVEDPLDLNGDGVTQYVNTIHMARWKTVGVGSTQIAIPISGSVTLKARELGTSNVYTHTVTVAQDSSTTSANKCTVTVAGPAKLCQGQSGEVKWTVTKGRVLWGGASKAGDCGSNRPVKKTGKKSATVKVKNDKKNKSGSFTVAVAYQCCEDTTGGSPSHTIICILVGAKLPENSDVVTGANGKKQSFSGGRKEFPAYAQSNGRKVTVAVNSPDGCDIEATASFSGSGGAGASFKAPTGGWGATKSVTLAGDGTENQTTFLIRGNGTAGKGTMSVTFKSGGKEICVVKLKMRSVN